MAKSSSTHLDACFHALSHPLRRTIIDRLADGPATVGSVSKGFRVAAPTVSKHLAVLEEAGLLRRERIGQDHYVALRGAPLRDATSWMARHERAWDERLDALEELVAKLDDADAAKKRSSEK